MSGAQVFTIGHSNRSEFSLIELLRLHQITIVVDVRSTPTSSWVPHFDRSVISATLKQHGIAYSFLGGQLGVRTDDSSCYQNNRIVYARLARSEPFQHGLRRVIKAADQHRLALMCTEQDPIACHRSILIAPALQQAGVVVIHILHPDGELETQQRLEARLLGLHNLSQPDMFQSDAERLGAAYAKQEQKIAYVRQTSSQEDV